MNKVALSTLASVRSGDKNDMVNIGVVAYDAEGYQTLKKLLTVELVQQHFGNLIKGEIIRYEWDAIDCLNFVCKGALDGGASRSMRMDTLGKNFSSHLLRLELTVE